MKSLAATDHSEHSTKMTGLFLCRLCNLAFMCIVYLPGSPTKNET